MPTRASALPAAASALIAGSVAAGVLVVLAAAAALGRAAPPTPAELGGAVLLATIAAVIQTRSPALVWRGRRIAVHPDEAVLLVGFALLPPALVVLLAVAAVFCAQIATRRPPLKVAFNASVHALSAGAAAIAVLAARDLGLAPATAAILSPLVVSVASQGLVAALLACIAGEPLRSISRPELAASIVLSTMAGTALGVLALASWEWSPIAILAIVPAAAILHRAIAHEYRHQNELSVRRALARATEKLVALDAEDAILEATRDACFEVFDLIECRIALAGREPRSWTKSGVALATRRIGVPLVALGGRTLGELSILVAWKGKDRLAEDRELLALVAGQFALAIANSRAVDARGRAERLEAVNALVVGIAHEINNPLMYALGHVEILEIDCEAGELDPATARDALGATRRGLLRIQAISRALAQATRRADAPRRDLDLARLAQDVAAESRLGAPEGVEVLCSTPETPLPLFVAPDEIRQAARALARNAIEATTRGRVTVEARFESGHAELVFTDAGAGVAPDVRDRLFTPFFTTKPDGVGLGLVLALRVARDHDGDVVVEDAPGGGARVRLRLPLAAAATR